MHTATDQTLLLIQKSKYIQSRYELESDTHLAPTYPVFSYSHFTTFRYIYSIRNSFKDDATFTMFIQMMYQLLLSFKFPFKCRKIMAVGPSDSGKTTWIGPILEVMDPQHVASITTETPFGAQMITASTQLLFVDEWSANRKQFDQCKMVFQGGDQVIAQKCKLPGKFRYQSGVYLTMNEVRFHFIIVRNLLQMHACFFNHFTFPLVGPPISP